VVRSYVKSTQKPYGFYMVTLRFRGFVEINTGRIQGSMTEGEWIENSESEVGIEDRRIYIPENLKNEIFMRIKKLCSFFKKFVIY